MKNQSAMLLELAMPQLELFHDSVKNTYVRINMGDYWHIYPITSKAFKRWLTNVFFWAKQKTVQAGTLSQVINTLDAKAVYTGPNMIFSFGWQNGKVLSGTILGTSIGGPLKLLLKGGLLKIIRQLYLNGTQTPCKLKLSPTNPLTTINSCLNIST